jgi:hypothetical protein
MKFRRAPACYSPPHHMDEPGCLGGAALALAALVYDVFLAALRRADHAFPSTDPTESTWWFGYARDLVNFLAFLMFAAGFRILEHTWPRALLAAGLWTLGAYGLDYFFGRALSVRRAELALAATLIVLAMVVAAARAPTADALTAVVRWLF